MTKKVFWDDPYATSHQTCVASVNGSEIELESTIFFAFSGGQESDHGSIAGIQVLSARKEGLRIIYALPPSHGLKVGQPVQVEIEWERRYRLMRLHFAAELVLEIFYKELNSVGKVGAHIAPDKARIDFTWPESISPLLPVFSEMANEIISSNRGIVTDFDDILNERRYWEIQGFSRVPCGGTHVRSTGEVGQIRLKRNNIGKGKERVEIFLCEP
ncbi:alanyl-tRNA editing protein [Thiobacillus sp.]|uniref:alanyl-tRNA editing protein n=1 Tax=Thiobacillus sp. TaxID=924 RepID=UPI00181EE9AE|nr:alanyl-tRNA editing protein [Thiobacillus sp.]MBC2731343.1 alanyl-tRNA editing protein [Thiobacillus sp.]MBC2740079.1 alanyl-tRNA editing protein [Thiobacillus sp.]MBC2758291.1 alanyl-tRNA editing protein [Thiobacillus sp.]